MDSMFVAMAIDPTTRGWWYVCLNRDEYVSLSNNLMRARTFHTKEETIDFIHKVAHDLSYVIGCEHFGYLEITPDFNLIKEV